MANKYKVGDRVKLVGWNESVYLKESSYGKIDTIRKVTHGEKYPYLLTNTSFRWRDEELEPACENKIVITTDGKTTLARLYDGSKVIKSAEAKCSPEDTFDFAVGAKLAYERLMVEEKKVEAHTYKSGDKVRIIGDSCWHGIVKGSVVTLKSKVTYSWCTYKDAWNIDESCVYVCEVDIEPYVALGYNGKVVCVKSDNGFKVGKVYEMVDGVLYDEEGDKRPEPNNPNRRIESLDDSWLNGKYEYHFIPYVE